MKNQSNEVWSGKNMVLNFELCILDGVDEKHLIYTHLILSQSN